MDYNDYTNPQLQELIYDMQINENYNKGGRCKASVDQHCMWIQDVLLQNRTKLRITDLGCGVGHYTHALARYNHICTGIDISKLAIDNANNHKPKNTQCNFIQLDITKDPFPSNSDLIICTYSTFNCFDRSQAKRLLDNAFRSLSKTGALYFEPMSYLHDPSLNSPLLSAIRSEGDDFYCQNEYILVQERTHTSGKEDPQLSLQNFIVDLGSLRVEKHTLKLYLYTKKQYENMLTDCGFVNIKFFSDPPPGADENDGIPYYYIVANKP